MMTLRLLYGLLVLAACSWALKFELHPIRTHDARRERCIRNFVARETLVVVTATVDGSQADGMQVNIHIKDSLGNEYAKPRDVLGEQRAIFTPHNDAYFDVCFENLLSGSKSVDPSAFRSIELAIDIGADAKDPSASDATEKIKPAEAELLRVEQVMVELVQEMEYLRNRELKLRDTNESTNTRIKWFGIATTWLLVGLWAWQILYLRAYFRSKHLI